MEDCHFSMSQLKTPLLKMIPENLGNPSCSFNVISPNTTDLQKHSQTPSRNEAELMPFALMQESSIEVPSTFSMFATSLIECWLPLLSLASVCCSRLVIQRIPPEPDLARTDVCFKALVYRTHLAIHFMRQNPTPGGFIVATSSMVGVHPIAPFLEYCGAKSGVSLSGKELHQLLLSVFIGQCVRTSMCAFPESGKCRKCNA
jgi:hypothetical protein